MEFLNFLKDNWLKILFAIWGLIALTQQAKRDEVRDRLARLLSNPVIDSLGKEGAIYSKEELKKIADSVSNVMIDPIETWVNKQKESINKQFDILYSGEKNYFKLFNHVFLLILFLCFLWGDGIAIANTLELTGLIDYVPNWLTQYELAVVFGSFVPLIVGGTIFFTPLSKDESVVRSDKPENQSYKNLYRKLSRFIIISSLTAVIFLSIGRYQAAYQFILSEGMNRIIKIVYDLTIMVLIPLNSTLSAFLIHKELYLGLHVIFTLIIQLLLVIPKIFLYVIKIIGKMGLFGLDIIIRTIVAVLYIFSFLFFTPLDMISNIFNPKHIEVD